MASDIDPSAPSIDTAFNAFEIPSRIRAAACIKRRWVSSISSSPTSGDSSSNSATEWRKNSASRDASSSLVSASSKALRADANARHAARTAATSSLTPAKLSRCIRWPLTSSKPLSSFWPCISTSVSDSTRSSSPEHTLSLIYARLRPSGLLVRRNIKPSSAEYPASDRTGCAG